MDPVDEKRDIWISKSLSYLLRHGAKKEKLEIDDHGNVEMQHLLNHNRIKCRHVTLEDVKRVVTNNNKNRFALKQHNGKLYICAQNGHSIGISNQNLEKLEPSAVPAGLFHGTYKAKLPAIIASGGLSRMNRNHIHLTTNMNYVRPTCDILIFIDTEKCVERGIVFYKSGNDVYLTEGLGGIVGPDLFRRVEERLSGANVQYELL
ncbi:hypothetical protein CANTEDRAFT_114403 [Yamadazyma tenuis ATCC 10573]|uniref:2'-phosphotransferase n=1 Tax=Candida tenuis (strain ATCC 10573 / BCRC 21748 / CBS 615 / JCM 9827 / NBRC 10315 / NRRL Y-1498 / VKM Y-70) TaxID=590646 RepID=G3B741_CANTC|nr:phosphotransferase KptA/Tpt1 [Yamadazyma tenuis ATCC 10573]XP_006687336.1 uncharacterized protein CANTEDRAFT_114403 [Yamadazyma tenuis ATCC 10573]EGV63542.1 phosphotransferase KptA/Tpt1 [Yamadazyma tenuis ATCC 10573]EGV63543.1 hypothetical protein CANTEDRAFT_114403 [Yamadazyma tenuis ATCC 10573]